MERGMPVDEEKQSSAYLLSELGGEELGRLRKQAAVWLSMELPEIIQTLPRNGGFVDLGCGVGLLADAVAQARPDAQVHGFDIDALSVEQSRRNFGERAGLKFGLRGLEQGPPPGFPLADVVVLRLVLMHLSKPGHAIEKARTWLKAGGVLHILETDDRAIVLEPESAEPDGLFDLMQEVQKRRGGDRHLGRDLPALLDSGTWTILGQRRILLDPQVTAAAVPQVFLPVAEFYLGEAERLGLAQSEHLQRLRRDLGPIREGVLTGAEIPLFHLWARNSAGATR
jgi:SAM-dependent methyltransferase